MPACKPTVKHPEGPCPYCVSPNISVCVGACEIECVCILYVCPCVCVRACVCIPMCIMCLCKFVHIIYVYNSCTNVAMIYP